MKKFSPAALMTLCTLLPALSLQALVQPASARARAEPVLKVDPRDNPLVIEGTLDEKTTSFSHNVRLTASGGDVGDVTVLSSDLTRVGEPAASIERGQVSIPSGLSFKRDQPRDVTVTISNVKLPGVYTGVLKFLQAGQAEGKALSIDIELRVQARPNVKSSASGFQLVRCAVAPCRATDWLLPQVMNGDKRILPLVNETLADVEVGGHELTMRGEKTGSVFTSADVGVEAPPIIPASTDVPIGLTFNRAALPPDRYAGTLRLKLKGADTPLPVSFTLDVRDGPWWPLAVIVLGILVGRLAARMASSEAQREDKFLNRYYAVKSRVEGLSDDAARGHLEGKLEEFMRRLDNGNETEETLTQALDKMDAQLNFFSTLDNIKRELAAEGLKVLARDVTPNLDSARDEMILGNAERAKQLRQEAEDRLRKAGSDKAMGGHEERFDHLLTKSREATMRAVRVGQVGPPAQPPGGRLNWLARLLAAASGGRIINAKVRYWLLRPLFYLLLLVLLSLVGLQSLYVSAGTTFGSAGFYDYLGLFLWGISADVAQRTLQNLQQAR